MNGRIEIAAGDRIYLDTNVFIEAVEGRGELGQLATSLLIANSRNEPQRLVTSELTLAELLVKPLELNRERLVRVYENWTITNAYLQVVPVERRILWYAADLRARDKTLKLPDAIHLTTAIEAKCRYFLTNDKRIAGQFGIEILPLTLGNLRALLKGQPDEPV